MKVSDSGGYDKELEAKVTKCAKDIIHCFLDSEVPPRTHVGVRYLYFFDKTLFNSEVQQ